MEPPPDEDPGVGDRPLGALALVAAAVRSIQALPVPRSQQLIRYQVERAYKMYTSGDFIVSGQPFNADSWGPATAKFMDYIAIDLKEKHWHSLFIALSSFSARAAREEALYNGVPVEADERVPLPPSDPPSPPCNE